MTTRAHESTPRGTLIQGLSLIVPLLLGMSLVSVATCSGVGISGDSLSYLGVANSLAAGRGFYDGSVPFVTQPPLYPILIAIGVLFGYEAMEAAAVVGLIAYGGLVVAVFSLTIRLSSPVAAFLACLFVATLRGVIGASSYALSEIVFMPLSVLALLLLVIAIQRHRDRQTTLRLVVATGAICSLALLTRFAGIALVLVCLLVVVVVFRSSLRAAVLSGLAIILPVAVINTPWFVRNHLIAGYVSGLDRRAGAHLSLPENVGLLIRSLSTDLMPVLHFGLRSFPGPLVIFTLSVALLFAVVACRRRGFASCLPWVLQVDIQFAVSRWGGELTILLYILVYVLMLIVMSSTTLFPAYDWPRYLLACYPMAVVLAISVLFRFVERGQQVRKRGAIVASMLFALWAVGYARPALGYAVAASSGQGFNASEWRESSGLRYLEALLVDEDAVYSDQPLGARQYLRRPIHPLPLKTDQDSVRELIEAARNHSGNTYVLLFTGGLAGSDPFFGERWESAEFVEMADEVSGFTLLNTFSDSVLYGVDGK